MRDGRIFQSAKCDLSRRTAGSFRGGTCTVDVLPSATGMQMKMGTHLHIAPSELNTPTPNNGSNTFLITAPSDLPEYPLV